MNILAVTGQQETLYKGVYLSKLAPELLLEGFRLIYPESDTELFNILEQNSSVCGVIFRWDEYNVSFCSRINQLNESLPLYTFVTPSSKEDASSANMPKNLQFFSYLSQGSQEIARHIRQNTNEYINNLLPPLTRSLFNYVRKGKYPFCTPGHMAGAAFQKSPAGSLFYDFFGENTMKADISISMTELGSLLDHTGPHLEAEKYIANTFGAEQSYIVTNGTSTSNKIVGTYAVPGGSSVLIDRNCHKSVIHLLMMNDMIPLWLKPVRNLAGIPGGIPKHEFTQQSIAGKVASTPRANWPVHAVITNSTYDGLLYNTQYIKETLDVPSIHFDSAWVPYTHFHSIYQGLSGMCGERITGKVIYETQSTHKMLAAFSQASLIHIKGDYNRVTFDEAWMMHTCTSPNYMIVSSIEMAAAMLRGNSGRRLMSQSIQCALSFRHQMHKLHQQAEGWFFKVWQPDHIDGPECWPLQPGEDMWHGFRDTDANHMYLDPVKVTIITPGIKESGEMASDGIPAVLVARFLDEHGIVVEKTGAYNLLLLFSIGIDQSKVTDLLYSLCDFKRAYDANPQVKFILPALYHQNPGFYRNMRIQTLAQGIHQLIKQHNFPYMMQQAFTVLPEMKMTPYHAFQHQIKGEVEIINIRDMTNRISANMLLPFPPGVPVIMPGEMITEASQPLLDFLIMICRINQQFPGFETYIHGVQCTEQGEYVVSVIAGRKS